MNSFWIVGRLVLIHTIMLLCAVTANHKDYKWIRLNPQKNGQNHKTINEMVDILDYDIDHLTKNDLLIGPGDFDAVQSILTDKGISYEIITLDVDKLQEEEEWLKESSAQRDRRSIVENVVNTKVLTYPEVVAWLEMMEDKYDKLMSLHLLGKSHEDRDVHYVKINEGPDRQIVVIEGGIHAREWASVSSVLSFIQKLLTSLSEDPNSILTRYSYIVMPLLNPDGYVYTHTEDRLWRKNRAQTIDRKCYGIDLNRNFNAHWNSCARRISFPYPSGGKSKFYMKFAKKTLFCAPTYSGKHPQSEAESKIVTTLLLPLRGQIKLFMSLHSFGELWIIPYGHSTTIKPPNHDNSLRVANKAVDAVALHYNITFELGTVREVVGYMACGSSMDWVVEKLGVGYAYTLEITNPVRLPNGRMSGYFDVQKEDLIKYGAILHTGVLSILEEVEEIER